MILIVDNYDSFTYNLVQRLGEIDANLDIQVVRNDEVTVDEILDKKPARVIISPGPCTPTEAGISVECAKRLSGKMPLLGVCLGHQSIAEAFGGTIVRADRLMHGKVDTIHHTNEGLFAGLPNPFQATRYHSLLIQPDTLPDEFTVTAWSDMPVSAGSNQKQREIMAIAHKSLPVFGLQFHPESYLTADGTTMLKHFLEV